MRFNPWNPPGRLRSGTYGMAGRASTTAQQTDPTAGRHGDTTSAKGRRKRNTMARGTVRNRPYPGELARDRDMEPVQTAPRIVPPAGRKFTSSPHPIQEASPRSGRKQAGTLSEAEGLRQRAMHDRSVMVTTGAVTVVPRTGPVWQATR